MRPADQQLGGADGADTDQLQQPGHDPSHQPFQLGQERDGLGLKGLDAAGGAAQRPHRHPVLQGSGRPVPQRRTDGDLPLGRQPAELGAELLGRGNHPGQGEAVGGELVVAVSSRARMGWTVPLGSPAAAPISTPYYSLAGSVSRACRTSWVGMVMRGVRGCSMLVVYLAPRLNTSYLRRRGIKYSPPS
jgi:hypothetical protein